MHVKKRLPIWLKKFASMITVWTGLIPTGAPQTVILLSDTDPASIQFVMTLVYNCMGYHNYTLHACSLWKPGLVVFQTVISAAKKTKEPKDEYKQKQ